MICFSYVRNIVMMLSMLTISKTYFQYSITKLSRGRTIFSQKERHGEVQVGLGGNKRVVTGWWLEMWIGEGLAGKGLRRWGRARDPATGVLMKVAACTNVVVRVDSLRLDGWVVV